MISNKKSILLYIFLLISIAQFCSDIHVPSLPAMASYFSISPDKIQKTVSLELLAFAIGLFFLGPISDFKGRRKIILTGISIFIIGSLLGWLAPYYEVLLIGRAVQGVGISCAGISASLARDCFTGAKLAKAFSIISMSLAIAPIVAPMIGGFIQEHGQWRDNFLFLFLFGLILLLFFWKKLPETLSSISSTPIKDMKILSSYIKVLRNPHFLGASFIITLVFSGEIAYLITTPFLLQKKLGLSPFTYGLLAIFIIAGSSFGAFLSSLLSHKVKTEKLLLSGVLLLCLGSTVLFLFYVLDFFTVWSIVLPFSLYMVGAGFAYPNGLAIGLNHFSKMTGTAASLMSILQVAGASLASFAVEMTPLNSQFPLSLFLMCFSIIALISYIIFLRTFAMPQEE